MCGQEDFIVNIIARLKRLDDDQSELDSVYSDLLEGLKSGRVHWACTYICCTLHVSIHIRTE